MGIIRFFKALNKIKENPQPPLKGKKKWEALIYLSWGIMGVGAFRLLGFYSGLPYFRIFPFERNLDIATIVFGIVFLIISRIGEWRNSR